MGAFGSMLSRSMLETPATPISSITIDDDYGQMLTGGEKSDAGMRVNVQTGLGYSPVWRAVNLISDYAGKLPVHVYEEQADGGRVKAKKHSAYQIVRRKPNPYTTAFIFKKTLLMHALFTGRGNGYAWIERKGSGEPAALWLLLPENVEPIRRNGELWYIYKHGEMKIRPEDIIHIKGPGYDGLVGYDIVTVMKQTLGLGLALKKFSSKFFSNHAIPGVVLQRPKEAGPLSEQAEARLIRDFDKIVVGLDNAHRTALLQEGMEAQVLAVDARKAQLTESRKFEVREVANFLGIPPSKLGDSEQRAYASLEQDNQSFLDDCLDGWLVQMEEEFRDKLLTEEQKNGETHYIEFLREAVVRVNLKDETESLIMEVNNGLRNPDEARAKRNLPAMPNGLGKKFRKPVNIGYADDPAPNPNPAPPVPPKTDENLDRMRLCVSHRGLLADAILRMHGRIVKQAERTAKKPADWLSWINHDLAAANRSTWAEWTAPVVEVALASGLAAAAEWDGYYSRLESSLLSLAECKADELPGRVEAWAAESLRTLPEQLAAEWVSLREA